VDVVRWFHAPIIIGGREAPGAVGGDGVAVLADAPRLRDVRVERVADDVLITGRLTPLPEVGGG
jgi:diaminohydroxyphosphoribosylaminopyrimidine deaminase/5-amino-6-(5-phosphoribosylamino)uracil reductase